MQRAEECVLPVLPRVWYPRLRPSAGGTGRNDRGLVSTLQPARRRAASIARATSPSLVRQFTTLTRIARRPASRPAEERLAGRVDRRDDAIGVLVVILLGRPARGSRTGPGPG